jgi:hypothetical protein
MGTSASTRRMPSARGSAPSAVDIERTVSPGRWRFGRAYRGGRLVCGCVHVAIRVDHRIGLTQRERRVIGVRFHEPVDDDLRAELTKLARRRGAASQRTAEHIAPIELVIDDLGNDHERMIGALQPPHRRHGPLRDIEFGFGHLRAR